MCGRYTLTVTWEELLAYYKLERDIGLPPFHEPRYNIAPGQMVPAIIHDGSKLRLGPLRWGLVPSWAKDDKMSWRTINARAETLTDKPAFRIPFQRKRCIIPADGFYEWKRVTNNDKQPMRIIPRNGGVLHLAGLYDTWQDEQGKRISTCTIVTTTPNRVMEEVHDRMPVILSEHQLPLWLERNEADIQQLQSLLAPCPNEWLTMYPVDSMVGNVSNDSPACIEPTETPPMLF
ncbi:SOS response-associated peptidase [Paenibacillus arenosi]|uniref:Abasic site processing protein n=1 Tax=Paenibacillus arenosi TaxID=2774142 RepID=A0ABR9ARZ1_9BACL|nr:SOS response-associated peptidase [Paenibacillus arenosi]MBD8496885.1 SOS response-associated peptidase [Paenibacillus arenosi]